MPGLNSVEFADFAIIASTPYSPKTFVAYTSITFSPIVTITDSTAIVSSEPKKNFSHPWKYCLVGSYSKHRMNAGAVSIASDSAISFSSSNAPATTAGAPCATPLAMMKLENALPLSLLVAACRLPNAPMIRCISSSDESTIASGEAYSPPTITDAIGFLMCSLIQSLSPVGLFMIQLATVMITTIFAPRHKNMFSGSRLCPFNIR